MKSKHSQKHYRFFVSPESILGDSFVLQEKGVMNQIRNVFRLKIGDKIILLDGLGSEYSGKISSILKQEIRGRIFNKTTASKEEKKITLFVPMIKNNKFDLILEKCTELGVSVFRPVVYSHSVAKSNDKKERWINIVREASEQCGRFFVPAVEDPQNLNDVISGVDPEKCFVSYEDADNGIDNKNILQNCGKEIFIFVGPEGGFSEEEISTMRERDFKFFNLGKNILRSETACILSVGFFNILC